MKLFIKTTIAAVIGLSATMAGAQTRLQGVGATFPEPLYKRWVAEYARLHPDVRIDYQGIGSAGGIRGITEKTADFAGSDAPMSKKEIDAAGGPDRLVEFPSCSGGVVPAYNVPGVTSDLKFTGEIIAEIYLGQISKWNDPKIAKINPGVNLPELLITPVWRTDGSGTTFIFTNYLATQSRQFLSTIGVAKQVKWPIGQGGPQNNGVAQIVQQTKGAIGYLEQNYAAKNNIPYGLVQNKAGKFVKATPESVSAAGEGTVGSMKGHIIHANIWNQSGDAAYPIASFTYLIVYKDLDNIKTTEQAQALADFLWWATHDGQKFNAELDYAPLSSGVQQKVEAALSVLTYKGQKVGTAQAAR